MSIRFHHSEEQSDNGVALSFEFFPPRSEQMLRRLWCTIGQLELLNPEFFSVTYGALGSARATSLETVEQIHAESSVPVAAHLTCTEATRSSLDERVRYLWGHGIRHILALRGDVPEGGESRLAYPGTVEFIEGIKAIGDFDITVAAYPEVHPDASNPAADLVYLKRKFDAGATRAISQYFFDADTFLRFRDDAAKLGITNIVPGILPIHDYDKIVEFSKRCGASIPEKYATHFAGMEDNKAAQYYLAVELGCELCRKLFDEGVDALHFYTLNQTDLSFAICQELGSAVYKKPPVSLVA